MGWSANINGDASTHEATASHNAIISVGYISLGIHTQLQAITPSRAARPGKGYWAAITPMGILSMAAKDQSTSTSDKGEQVTNIST